MNYIVNSNEAKQLNKQGFNVTAGQIVELSVMPEWLQKRAQELEESRATANNPAREAVTRNFGDNSTRAKSRWISDEMRRAWPEW